MQLKLAFSVAQIATPIFDLVPKITGQDAP